MENRDNDYENIPNYIFETSWEVCNKVGGIHTVISTKSVILKEKLQDHLIMVGPDIWKHSAKHPEFEEDKELFVDWKSQATQNGLNLKIGRWKIKSEPIAILIDFSTFLLRKNDILGEIYNDYKVDSLTGGWDYIEPVMFGYAAGTVIKSFYDFYLFGDDRVVAHFHEWMTVAGALYLKKEAPEIGTVFTTHATVLGRCLGSNTNTFYKDIERIDGDAESKKFNVISKHSLEKTGAIHADVFSTVSSLTAHECELLLQQKPIVTPNGFEPDFVPKGKILEELRSKSRKLLLNVYKSITGRIANENAFILMTSGRYEFKNKGYDVFIDVLQTVQKENVNRDIIAFIMVPSGNTGPKQEIIEAFKSGGKTNQSDKYWITHYLQNEQYDPIVNKLRQYEPGIGRESNSLSVIFVPSYLNGNDGIFNVPYYDLLAATDLTLFPSYYEPWGYTPLESLAFHVPTVTTTLAGFGQWLTDSNELDLQSGAFVVKRTDDNYSMMVENIARYVMDLMNLSHTEYKNLRSGAYKLSQLALWKNQISAYYQAYDQALNIVKKRSGSFRKNIPTPDAKITSIKKPVSNQPTWNKLFVETTIPASLEPMMEICQNIWWSWNQNFLSLLEEMDEELWNQTKNPVAFIRTISQQRLNEYASNQKFTDQLQSIHAKFKRYISGPGKGQVSIAYFSMEYGFHASVKLYSGGLGILAGDYLKQCSDDNINLFGIGLLYQYGYFNQQISTDGTQISEKDENKFTHLPIFPVCKEDGSLVKIWIPFPGRVVTAKVWKLPVGRIALYLLDTNVPENNNEDRSITDKLYSGDKEHRLKQEIVLGIGGVRFINEMGLEPDVYHLNEGHAAFASLERIASNIQRFNLDYDEALELIKQSTLFTTHTPVPAGHDTFSEDLIRIYLWQYLEKFQIQWTDFMAMGQINRQNAQEKFSMSNLAIKTSAKTNGVSKIHEGVSKKMFSAIWDGFHYTEVPITSVTNGVHLRSWLHGSFKSLVEPHIENEQNSKNYSGELVSQIDLLSDDDLRRIRLECKHDLLSYINNIFQQQVTHQPNLLKYVAKMKKILEKNILIIGFARRFATYKRALLIFEDLDRLKAIINNSEKPVMLIFAGKAHPADEEGKRLIKRIYEISQMPEFIGKIIFLENYDIDMASYLISGVDVWLNTPTRPMEASGTSGMKAAINGVLNLSVLDGWWAEAWKEDNGWSLPQENQYSADHFQNQLDAYMIYSLLEEIIIPMYYLGDKPISNKWLEKIRNSIKGLSFQFNTHRMLTEYLELYHEIAKKQKLLTENEHEELHAYIKWQRKIFENWPLIELKNKQFNDFESTPLISGDKITFELLLDLGALSEEDVKVEVLFTKKNELGESIPVFEQELLFEYKNKEVNYFKTTVDVDFSGVHRFAFRVVPKHKLLFNATDINLIKWI